MANPTVKHWQDPVNLILGLWLISSVRPAWHMRQPCVTSRSKPSWPGLS